MNRISVSLLALVLAACGNNPLSPSLNVKVKAVPLCDATDGLEEVNIMQLRTVDAQGNEETTQASKGSKSVSLSDVTIEDGTTVFLNGFENAEAAASESPVLSAGASMPLNLKSHVAANQFPGARAYPADATEILIPFAKVYTFGSTTDPSKGSAPAQQCSTMTAARHGHTATFMPVTGKVLIVGGLTHAEDGAETFVPRANALEEYDPATGKYSVIDPGTSLAPLMQRAYHTATLLPDGTVLVWGGVGPEGSGGNVTPRAVSFIWDPTKTGDARVRQIVARDGFQNKRFHHQATLTGSGVSVVITGGCGCVGSLTPDQLKSGQCPKTGDACTEGLPRVGLVDVFDTTTKNTRTLNTPLVKARAFHNAVAVGGELVVIIGGDDGVNAISNIEIFGRTNGGSILSDVSDALGPSAVTHASSVVINSADCARLASSHPGENECIVVTGGCRSPLRYFQVDEDGMEVMPGAASAKYWRSECPSAQQQSTGKIIDFGEVTGSRVKDGPSAFRKRWGHQAFYLPNGPQMMVLIGGGFETMATDSLPVSAEILPRNDVASPFGPATPFMKFPRERFATARFPSGQILILGGVPHEQEDTPVSMAEGELFFFPFR